MDVATKLNGGETTLLCLKNKAIAFVQIDPTTLHGTIGPFTFDDTFKNVVIKCVRCRCGIGYGRVDYLTQFAQKHRIVRALLSSFLAGPTLNKRLRG